ncbi:MAG: electron transfer flavoprotein subunit alpha/FixB family protein [Anaerolineae bacterium]
MDFSYLDEMVGEELGPVEEIGTGYRHVWVVAEVQDGAVAPPSLEVLGKARELADGLGVYLYGVLLGHGVEDLGSELIPYGADKVWVVDDPVLATYQVETYVHALALLVEERRPEILLLSASDLGNDLAPRLAQRLGTGLLSHCVDLSLDMAERQLLGTCPVMGGAYFHTYVCPEARPQVATVEPGQFRAPYADTYRTGEVETVAVDFAGVKGRVTWQEFDIPFELPPTPLSQARVIVAGGRGMGSAEAFGLLQELAAALGGEVAGSRGAVDEGWIAEDRQVGVSNTPVAPKLYLACGISGSVFHRFGMLDAGFTVAINSDPEAPIFQGANVGVVGDAPAVVRELLALLQKR